MHTSTNIPKGIDLAQAKTKKNIALTHTYTSIVNRRVPGDPVLDTDNACANLMRAPSPENFAAIPLAFEPGSAFRYSSGTTLLGRVVEKVAGQVYK